MSVKLKIIKALLNGNIIPTSDRKYYNVRETTKKKYNFDTL